MRRLLGALALLGLLAAPAGAQTLYADRVRETTTTTGTGTLSLAGAVTNYRTFVAGIGDGNTTTFCIVHRTAAEWECSTGVVTDASPDTLSRDTVRSSSTGSAVNFSAGTKDVFAAPLSTTFYSQAFLCPLCSDNGSALTYTGASGIAAAAFVSTGSGAGVLDLTCGSAPSASATDHAKAYCNSTSDTLLLSLNGGSYQTVLVDPITSGTAMAGSLLATAISAPSTPASGKGSIYVDSTSKNLAVKDDAGTVKHGVQTTTCTSGDFVSAISAAGAVTCSAPSGGGGGGDTCSYVSSQQDVTSAGLVDITNLTFSAGANDVWKIDTYIVYRSSSTGMGVLIAINGPASPTRISLTGRKQSIVNTAGSTTLVSEFHMIAYDTPIPNSTSEPVADADLLYHMTGVVINGANSGTIAMRLSKENAAGTASVMPGSWLCRRKLN